MINVRDLNIEAEIVPLFDFTYNSDSGNAVKDILLSALDSENEILLRQDLLKGFAANWEVLKHYSYSRFDLSETYAFFQTIFIGSVSTKSLRLKLMFSEKARAQKRGKLILLVRLFYAINRDYLTKINTGSFPPHYASELEKIKTFFAAFNLEQYEKAFIKNKFGSRQMAGLIMIITEKIATREAEAFWKRWFLFEAYLSISAGIAKHNFVFPTFDENGFSLKSFYHPVLKQAVKNDFEADKHVVILTGPNMSGKSTLLKALALCVYLAHAGLAVPASMAVMPFFSTISVAINLTDSIVSGYSHFMSEIITLKNVLKEAGTGARCFAVFDELFRGTNIEDALEISSATIKGLINFPDSFFVISTHLQQLRALEEIENNSVSTCFIDCKLTDDIPAFTYKLKEGWSDLKLGRILFEKEGLNTMLGRTNEAGNMS